VTLKTSLAASLFSLVGVCCITHATLMQ